LYNLISKANGSAEIKHFRGYRMTASGETLNRRAVGNRSMKKNAIIIIRKPKKKKKSGNCAVELAMTRIFFNN